MNLRSIVAVLLLLGLSNNCFSKEPVIAVVLATNMTFYQEVADGFKEYLTGKGAAGKFDEYSLAGQQDKDVFAKVSSTNPDLILTVGEAGLKSAKQFTSGVPVVFSMVFNTIGLLDQNTTGVSVELPTDMKIAAIKKVMPNAKTIGLLYSPKSEASYREIVAECVKQGLVAKGASVNSDAEFSAALNSVFEGSDCFLVIMDTKICFSQTIKMLLLEAIKNKIPVVGLSSFFTKAGALVSFDCDYKDIGVQAGEISSKILAGEKAGTIKPMRPRKYKYSLNLATAEKIGITLSPSVVKDAADVVK